MITKASFGIKKTCSTALIVNCPFSFFLQTRMAEEVLSPPISKFPSSVIHAVQMMARNLSLSDPAAPALRLPDISENVLLSVLAEMSNTTNTVKQPDLRALFRLCDIPDTVEILSAPTLLLSEGSVLLTSSQLLNAIVLSQWTEARTFSRFAIKRRDDEKGVWELIGYK